MGTVVFLLNRVLVALLCKREWAKNKQANFEGGTDSRCHADRVWAEGEAGYMLRSASNVF